MVHKNHAAWIPNCLLIILFSTVLVFSSDVYKIVNTKNGSVRGKQLYTLLDKMPYYSFKGIPYAAPPINNLRFKAPETAILWGDVKDAFDFGSECVQLNMMSHEKEGSEDCLFLNVYIPALASDETLSVMVFIHGGGYYSGTGNFYGPDFLLENNVILVTLNYRLGPFGFLSLGTAEYSGNMGLKDQLAALQWVNDNIEFFGGDKNSITLFGQSAGSASTHYHVISPVSRGLFQRAILQSGTAISPWAYYTKNNHFEHLKHLLKKRDITNTNEMLDYLINVDAATFSKDSYVDIYIPGLSRREVELIWSPIVEVPQADKPFLNKQTEDLMSKRNVDTIDTFFGFNSAETFFPVGIELVKPEYLKAFDKTFEIQLPMKNLKYDYASKEYKKIAAKIRNFYFGKNGKVNNYTLIEYNDLMSDCWVVYGVDTSAKYQSARSTGKTFYYHFALELKYNAFKKHTGATDLGLPGASHADDLFYVFRMNDPFFGNVYESLENDSKEVMAIRDLTKLWTNFAKYGNPTHNFGAINLKPIQNSVINFLNITNEGFTIGTDPFGQRVAFWNNLFNENKFLFENAANEKDEL